MRSMTGFATTQGLVELGAAARERGGSVSDDGTPPNETAAKTEVTWRWDLRSVNGRGLEVRFRTPPGWDALEPAWRRRLSAHLARGSVTAALTVAARGQGRGARVNLAALDEAVAAARVAQERLRDAGLETAPVRVEGLLGLRGVFGPESDAGRAETMRGDGGRGSDVDETAGAVDPEGATARAVGAGFAAALDALSATREAEGAQLRAALVERIDAIDALRARAVEAAERRGQSAAERLRQKLSTILEATQGAGGVDEGRVVQELALLAMKADVSEELDRLAAHVAAARALIDETAPIGRKFEFLTQEFHREANTLCAKSQDAALTEIGLALKVAIDQVREQAANVE